MTEIDAQEIEKLRTEIGEIPNYFPHIREGKYYIKATKEVPLLDKNGKPVLDKDGKPKTTEETLYREHFDAMPTRKQAVAFPLIGGGFCWPVDRAFHAIDTCLTAGKDRPEGLVPINAAVRKSRAKPAVKHLAARICFQTLAEQYTHFIRDLF